MDWGEAVPMTPQEKAAVELTTSSWFSSQSEYQQLLGAFEFYLAPRLAEGIGFSFLEAMARNRIVIAHNSSTMNEYIRHGKTGFLFSLKRVHPLPKVDLEMVRKRLASYMEAGYRHWLEDQSRLQEFLKS
jgi:glycosyltransferase involved in cell wall biosynthesis